MIRTVCRHIKTMSSSQLRKYAEGTQPFTVLIEGNIGSGKTTFLNHFKKHNDVCSLSEPVEKWQNLNGYNLLDLMYKEPDHWALPFQTYVTLTRLELHTEPTDKSVKMIERSLYSSRYCFVEAMLANGTIHEGMYNILQDWYKFIEQTIHIQADLIIYLRTSPEVVYERMKKRARTEESCVPLKYLEELHSYHENWLAHRKIGNLNVPILTLDANLDLENIGSEYKRSEDSIFKTKLPMAAATTIVREPVYVSPSKRSRLSS